MVLSILIKLCNIHHYLVSEYFHQCHKTKRPFTVTAHSHLPPAPTTTTIFFLNRLIFSLFWIFCINRITWYHTTHWLVISFFSQPNGFKIHPWSQRVAFHLRAEYHLWIPSSVDEHWDWLYSYHNYYVKVFCFKWLLFLFWWGWIPALGSLGYIFSKIFKNV